MNEGRMMDFPLLISHLLDRARSFFSDVEIVSRMPDGSLTRTNYGEVHGRCQQLANALTKLGVKAGDRVATLSWNHARHLEAYLTVPSMGAVLHTLNLRLHPSEIGYIASHAGDKVVIVDRSLMPLFEKFRAEVPSIEHVIVIPDCDQTATTPNASDLDYEAFLAAETPSFEFPRFDENTAAMICYTSGTTGKPKGVLYSHRSVILHTLVCGMSGVVGMSAADTVLPVVPMFHAAAWGLPFIAAAVGAKVVFPGPMLDPKSLLDLMAKERVTLAGGVPTIWLGILALLDKDPKGWDLSAMQRMMVGGSAAPPAMIDGFSKRHGLQVVHAWGMTEMSPVGTVARLRSNMESLSDAEKLAYRSSQGFAVPLVEQRHVGEDGKTLAWDGKTMGELEVRGPWVAASYYADDGPDRFTADGWFKTGDVVTIDPRGYVRITDRSKDVVKSGGEWISSVDLENALMSHPCVLEAAVFAGQHEKWAERPIAAVVFKEGQSAEKDELLAHLAPNFPKFWMPDAIVFLKQIPRTSTGKFLKTKLREEHGHILLEGGNAAKKSDALLPGPLADPWYPVPARLHAQGPRGCRRSTSSGPTGGDCVSPMGSP